MVRDGYDMVIENIRSIIAEKGLKQKAVAEKAGFTPQEFSNILNDRRKLIRVEHIAPIAVALGVEPNDLYASGAREGAQAGGNPSGENIAG